MTLSSAFVAVGTRGGGVYWLGRTYAHFILPAETLGARERAWFDEQVCGAGGTTGWAPLEGPAGDLVVARYWQHTGGRMLRLVMLGGFPLLVSLSAPGAVPAEGVEEPVAGAMRRVFDAMPKAGGRPVTDNDLATYVALAPQRWTQGWELRRRRDEYRPSVDYRYCEPCRAWSARENPLCRVCGRRFTAQEDEDWAARRKAAQRVVEESTTKLRALVRGDDLQAPPPPPGVPGPPAPAGRGW
jgi:hypothetical protein